MPAVDQTCSITSSVPDGDGSCRQARQFFAEVLTDFEENERSMAAKDALSRCAVRLSNRSNVFVRCIAITQIQACLGLRDFFSRRRGHLRPSEKERFVYADWDVPFGH
jgi:hypothetical protein